MRADSIFVTVDGETVFEYVDANPVEEKLCRFSLQLKSTFEVVKSTELSNSPSMTSWYRDILKRSKGSL